MRPNETTKPGSKVIVINDKGNFKIPIKFGETHEFTHVTSNSSVLKAFIRFPDGQYAKYNACRFEVIDTAGMTPDETTPPTTKLKLVEKDGISGSYTLTVGEIVTLDHMQVSGGKPVCAVKPVGYSNVALLRKAELFQIVSDDTPLGIKTEQGQSCSGSDILGLVENIKKEER